MSWLWQHWLSLQDWVVEAAGVDAFGVRDMCTRQNHDRCDPAINSPAPSAPCDVPPWSPLPSEDPLAANARREQPTTNETPPGWSAHQELDVLENLNLVEAIEEHIDNCEQRRKFSGPAIRLAIPRHGDDTPPLEPDGSPMDDEEASQLRFLMISSRSQGKFRDYAKSLSERLVVECADCNPYIQALSLYRQEVEDQRVDLCLECVDSLPARLATQRSDALADLSSRDPLCVGGEGTTSFASARHAHGPDSLCDVSATCFPELQVRRRRRGHDFMEPVLNSPASGPGGEEVGEAPPWGSQSSSCFPERPVGTRRTPCGESSSQELPASDSPLAELHAGLLSSRDDMSVISGSTRPEPQLKQEEERHCLGTGRVGAAAKHCSERAERRIGRGTKHGLEGLSLSRLRLRIGRKPLYLDEQDRQSFLLTLATAGLEIPTQPL